MNERLSQLVLWIFPIAVPSQLVVKPVAAWIIRKENKEGRKSSSGDEKN